MSKITIVIEQDLDSLEMGIETIGESTVLNQIVCLKQALDTIMKASGLTKEEMQFIIRRLDIGDVEILQNETL